MWKEVKLSPYYLINENGDVKRKEYVRTDILGRKTIVKEKMLKQHKDKYGYARVTLCTGLEKPLFALVHRLVAQTFIENPNNLPCVNHKNEDITNNNYKNLEWCTIAYNNNYGKRNENAKKTLTKKYGKKVIAIKDEKRLMFNSVSEAGRKLNIKTPNIFNCLSGTIKTTGGYKFIEYGNEVI